jgi:lipopolysaccharide transport protein LptA
MLSCGEPDLGPVVSEGMSGARLELAGEDGLTLSLASAQVEETPLRVEGKQVSALLEGPQPVQISGATSRLDLGTGAIEFEGDVQLVQGEVSLGCRLLKAEYSDDTFKAALATGDVRVTKGDVVAKGQKAAWDADVGSVTLTGEPVLQDQSRRLRGEEIVIYLDERRLECRNCSLVIETTGVE